ncbi:3-oxoacyl-[acyl-carrier protein] reductase [Roseovarius nanhaiticus]|uniref:3-oxoacyl-[acyl-carrier protein] reductase n=1 Tax=Roseovarius nanhaiticus TaxID=573024 RepID=A0A1N7ENH1_9RHOB|nr:SDR family NAD(P)-dependent oxidoreductase [Roseovarius nanhaiticus]SEK70606.1 3-oxoacyl-[acyl-carrier protein] reductase [Roseovarius nanhaiticus]SIR89641.1 3-oxoacyl-[acyl-carrier protein] reductase [Roseovarius nanhaiticus]
MNASFDFTGRTLLLTGAAGGIGRCIAQLFHRSGANLVLGDRDQGSLSALSDELGGDRIATLAGDAANPDDAQKLVDLAISRFGGIDYLIPGAGIYPAQRFAQMTDEDWRRLMAINLDGVFYICRRTQPHLKPGGAIVFLTSLAPHRGAQTNAHYAAAKGAVGALMRSLTRELAPDIRCNAIAPGIIDTPMIGDFKKTRSDETLRQTPLARLGLPEEVASVAAFLASDAASFVSGETIQVNGGLYMVA